MKISALYWHNIALDPETPMMAIALALIERYTGPVVW